MHAFGFTHYVKSWNELHMSWMSTYFILKESITITSEKVYQIRSWMWYAYYWNEINSNNKSPQTTL